MAMGTIRKITGLPAISLTSYIFRNKEESEGKYVVHRNVMEVTGKLNKKGIYRKVAELESYFRELEGERKLEIGMKSGESNSVAVEIAGEGLVPDEIRKYLHRKMHIEKIEPVYVEVKAFALCDAHQLDELREIVRGRVEFSEVDSANCRDHRGFCDSRNKEFALYGSYGRFMLKIYKIVGINSKIYSVELMDGSRMQEKDFASAVGEMFSILHSFGSEWYMPVANVDFSKKKVKEPHGRILETVKPRNCSGASDARAEALDIIDSNGFIPYLDLLSLYSYTLSGDKYGSNKSASKFIRSHQLVRENADGMEIVKRAGSPSPVFTAPCHGASSWGTQPV